ncbi:MAG TPA: pyrimidine dimer DNA glycosylase/endonuclease V [Syntrophales bacterium]|nr:pyrimidine dimer DNA glycosylase/endonuclease V [Syntrophales bacterium]
MRIWTIHPRYLDRQGLLALWREGLLAQAVLLGKTRGYIHHPQLIRFQDQPSPVATIATYLEIVHDESMCRGYHFDRTKIRPKRVQGRITETHGQLLYEWDHLKKKLSKRSPEHYLRIQHITKPEPHPIFEIIPGEIRDWEKRTAEAVSPRPSI